MNIQRPQPTSAEIQQLIALFRVSRQICRERATELQAAYPDHLIVLQILAACHSLEHSHNRAIELYQRCLEIEPDQIAFLNNMAKNYAQIEDYHMAATFLNDIKQKWNHPSIYLNLAFTYQEGRVRDARLVEEAFEKMDEYRRNCPDFQDELHGGLIHTFLLQPEQNYNEGKLRIFSNEVLQNVALLQKMLHEGLKVDEVIKILEVLHPKILKRIDQMLKYGMRIENSLKATIQVFEGLKTIIMPLYRIQNRAIFEKYLIDSIQIANKKIFTDEIDESIPFSRIFENQVQPFLIKLKGIAKDIQLQIAKSKANDKKQVSNQRPVQQLVKVQPIPVIVILDEPVPIPPINPIIIPPVVPPPIQPNPPKKQLDEAEVQHLKERRRQDEEIRKNEKDNKASFEREGFPEGDYNFYTKFDEIEELIEKYQSLIQETLKVEGQSIFNPLLLIIRFREHNIDSYYVYYNRNRINKQLIRAPNLPNLQNIDKQSDRSLTIKYYHLLNLIFKFYNFYATNNFEYKIKGSFESNLDFGHFVTLLTPVFNEFFQSDPLFSHTKFGWIFNEVYFAVSQYFRYTDGSHLKREKQLLRQINKACEMNQNGVEIFMNDILKKTQKIFYDHLINQQFTNLYGSRKEHRYFNWKINRYHLINPKKQIRYAFNFEDDWVISNVALLLITMGQKKLGQGHDPLVEAFTDCFYKEDQSYKEQIIKKFYTSNHEIPIKDKVATFLKKNIKSLLPTF